MNVLVRSTTTIIPASVKSSDSQLLKYTKPWTIDLWRHHAYKSKKLLESYELLEIQLFKNKFNVEHEFLISKFKSPEEVIFIAVERSAKYSHLDHEPNVDDINHINQAMIRTKRKDENNGIFSNRSSISSSNSLSGASAADDMVMVIRGPTTFENAAEHFMKTKISRYSRSSYLPRGSMKFRTTESNVASSSSPTDTRATTPPPNLMHFSYAAIAAHRTRLYYTPTGQNCYWFANAILFILKEKFEPSEPFTVHSTVGTWSFGLLKVSLGSLQKMDFELLVQEYNTCVVEQSGVMMTKTPEQIKGEQQREAERQQLELQILDAETKVTEAEARAREKETELELERAKFEKERAEYQAKIKALEMSSASAT